MKKSCGFIILVAVFFIFSCGTNMSIVSNRIEGHWTVSTGTGGQVYIDKVDDTTIYYFELDMYGAVSFSDTAAYILSEVKDTGYMTVAFNYNGAVFNVTFYVEPNGTFFTATCETTGCPITEGTFYYADDLKTPY